MRCYSNSILQTSVSAAVVMNANSLSLKRRPRMDKFFFSYFILLPPCLLQRHTSPEWTSALFFFFFF